MNIALALLFILQLHSIQLQPISGEEKTFTKMLANCDEFLITLNRITQLKSDIDEFAKKIREIRNQMRNHNAAPNTFDEVTKIIETLQNAKNSFEMLTPFKTKIKTSIDELDKMRMLKRDFVHSWKSFPWHNIFPKYLEDAIEDLEMVIKISLPPSDSTLLVHMYKTEWELKQAELELNKMKIWQSTFTPLLDQQRREKLRRSRFESSRKNLHRIDSLHRTTQPNWAMEQQVKAMEQQVKRNHRHSGSETLRKKRRRIDSLHRTTQPNWLIPKV
uniref:Hypotheticial protein n=1 Tax=Schistosoma japonicum TaxID=6182 RepID=C7TY26_SCHJA|nr:hypotheticial protein [Schistosoma japonicum]